MKVFPESAKLLNEEDLDEQDNIVRDKDEVTVGESKRTMSLVAFDSIALGFLQ